MAESREAHLPTSISGLTSALTRDLQVADREREANEHEQTTTVKHSHPIPIPAPILIPASAGGTPEIESTGMNSIGLSISQDTLSRNLQEAKTNATKGHSKSVPWTSMLEKSRPSDVQEAILDPGDLSSVSPPPTSPEGAMSIPHAMKRDRSKLEKIKPGAISRARHASMGSVGSVQLSGASYESMPKSPAVSFLAKFAASTTPVLNHGHLATEGDQIGNYVLGQELDRGAFSSVVEAWTTEPAGVGEEGFRHVAIKVVSKESGGGSPVLPGSVGLPFQHTTSMNSLASVNTDFGSVGSNLGLGLSQSQQRIPSPAPISRGELSEPADSAQENLDREIAIWQRLRHPNVIRMVEVLDTEHATYIVSELADGGSLFQLLQLHPQGLPEKVAWILFRQIAEGLRYLHEDVAVCHGDLKLENVLLSLNPHIQGLDPREVHVNQLSRASLENLAGLESGALERIQVKIADFGMAEYIGNPLPPKSEAGIVAGTLPYLAPEMLRRNAANQGATHSPRSMSSPHLAQMAASGHERSPYERSPYERSPVGSFVKAASHQDFGPIITGAAGIGSSSNLSPSGAAASGQGATVSGAQDMWAAAVILFALLTGSLPFQDEFAPRLQMKIMRGQYDESLLSKRAVTLSAREVIKRCLQVRETERWNIRQLVESTWVSSGPSY